MKKQTALTTLLLLLFSATGLCAADVFWTTPSGNWLADSWYDAVSGGNPVSAPKAADTACIIGTVTLSGSTATRGVLDNAFSSNGTVNIASGGFWQSTGTLFVGQYALGILNIESGGTLEMTSTYPVILGASETALGIMRVNTSGTVKSTGYISIGQGDSYNNFMVPSSTLWVGGYVSTDSYLRIANLLGGVLHVVSTGTVMVGHELRIAENTNYVSTGIAIVAGHVGVGDNIVNGYYERSSGFLDIKTTGTVLAAGNYTQNTRSSLAVELNDNRAPDTLNPSLPAPFITATGTATLSGTLYVYGPGAATIQYTGNGEGKASDLSGIPILRATAGITGDFDTIIIFDIIPPTNIPDFIRLGGFKFSEAGPLSTRYDIGYSLAWNADPFEAHGTFTIENNKTFEIDIPIANRTAIVFNNNIGTYWRW